MAKFAKDAGLGRESLYKALALGAKPRYDTMLKLLHALGVKLCASPAHS
jgi:probable addiction module antidote protein